MESTSAHRLTHSTLLVTLEAPNAVHSTLTSPPMLFVQHSQATQCCSLNTHKLCPQPCTNLCFGQLWLSVLSSARRFVELSATTALGSPVEGINPPEQSSGASCFDSGSTGSTAGDNTDKVPSCDKSSQPNLWMQSARICEPRTC